MSDPIEAVSRFAVLPLWRIKNSGKDALYLADVRRTQYLPCDELHARQSARLKALLIHAGTKCPFYARRFAEASFSPYSVEGVDELSRIPMLTKQDIQTHFDQLKAEDDAQDDPIVNQTGGSTGSPLRFLMSRDSCYHRIANTIRHDSWAGLEPYHRAASLWGHRRDLSAPRSAMDRIRGSLISRRIVLDASSITSSALNSFVQRLNQSRPRCYVAYANVMYLLARFIRESPIRKYHRPNSIITSAEFLSDEQRVLIEEVFGCKVFNRYGCREFSVIASECEEHDGMHMAAETQIVEVVRNGQVCKPGEIGQLVITDLYNYAMPFIRYAIGDVGMLVDGPCACGRTLPRMRIVGGRVTDFLVTPDGTAVSGAAMTIYFVARIPGIRQAQIVQKELDYIVLRLVLDDAFGPESNRLTAEAVERFFGPKMRFDIEHVSMIPTEASGKYRFSVSEIDPLGHLQ